MKVYCPNCQTGYEINASLIGEKGKKLRCAKCKQVWTCHQNDLVDNIPEEETLTESITEIIEDVIEDVIEDIVVEKEELKEDLIATEPVAVVSTAPEPVANMNEVFARLSKKTEQIKAEEEKQIKQVRDFKKFFGIDNKANHKYYYILVSLLFVLNLNYFRFEITRILPFMSYAYKVVGIDSIVPGEGLKFSNVMRELFEEDAINKMEVKGYIINTTSRQIKIPKVILSLLNRDAYALQTMTVEAPSDKLAPDDRVAFRIVLSKPSALGKYIYLTFQK